MINNELLFMIGKFLNQQKHAQKIGELGTIKKKVK